MLKRLVVFSHSHTYFTFYSEAKYCLKNLSELHCDSNINSEIFYQLSQICHNIQSLTIEFGNMISNGLTDLISVQKNLKYFDIIQHYNCDITLGIIPLLATNLSNTIIKLSIYHRQRQNTSLSFITNFTSLQELEFLFDDVEEFKGFENLQYTNFPKLQILRIQYSCPRYELLAKFLEINGRNLKKLYLDECSDYSVNLAIAKFCINLRKLTTKFKNDELETLKMVFDGCQYLETIEIW